MTSLRQDLNFAVRSLRRTPAVFATAVLVLGVGIGLATAVFTVADALLIRRMPVRDQDRLVALWVTRPNGSFTHYPLSLADARDFARRTRTMSGVAFTAYEGAWPVSVRDGDSMSRARRALVSGNFFDVLGTHALLGRALRPSDDVIGAAPVLVLSYAAWQHRFAGDRHVLGRRLMIFENGVTYTVVGVMPSGLDYPRGAELWAPVIPARPAAVTDVDLVGRLGRGATPDAARAELSAFFARSTGGPVARTFRGVVTSLPRLVLGDTRPALFAFAAAAALLLLITCVDVANLLLVRGIARAREIAVRSALGAERWRITLQLLVENILLGTVGAAFGLLVAAAAVPAFVAFAPDSVPRLDQINLNGTALAGSIAITVVATLLFGLAPALTTSHVEAQDVLRSGTRQSVSRRSRRVREALVACQMALALVVLSAAALLARSLLALERAPLSFEPSHLLIADLTVRFDEYNSAAKQLAMVDDVLHAVQAMPGVRAVSPAVAAPFAGPGGWDGRPTAEGQTAEESAANPMLNMDVVAPGYFAALGVPLLRGRAFTDADRMGSPPVAIVSESAARYYWPNQDPIGKRLGNDPQLDDAVTVVGVVPDTRYRDLRDARASIYYPLSQPRFPFAPLTLVVRTSGPPGQIVPELRHAIAESASGVALASASPFEALLDKPLAQPRLDAYLLLIFAAAAVLLAAVGLFGVLSAMVREQTRELGVRMALGATATSVRRLVLGRALVVAGVGLAAGLALALAGSRLVSSLLFGVRPNDPASFAATCGMLVVVGLLAAYLPARRATRIDPAQALRTE